MKILMPFWDLNRFDRFYPQMKAIADNVDKFFIIYTKGEPLSEWRENFEFVKIKSKGNFITRALLRSQIYNEIKKLDVDLVYTISGGGQEISSYLAEKKQIPYVLRLRGNHIKVRKIEKCNFLKRYIYDFFYVRNLRKADLIIPISQDLSKHARMLGISKERITPPVVNGVDTSLFKPMPKKSKKFTVLCVGRLSKEKGIQRFLDLAKRLNKIDFLLAGVQKIKVDFPSNVKYLGYVPHNKMNEVYNQADLVILPSLSEGFPNVLLEAYACGKPVLATPEAFPRELEIFGSVVRFEEFEREMSELKNFQLELIGKQARKHAEKCYSWNAFGKRIKTCFVERI